MKKADIRIGGVYAAKVDGKPTEVRVVKIRQEERIRQGGWTVGPYYLATLWDVVDTQTGKQTTFDHVAKFRGEVFHGGR